MNTNDNKTVENFGAETKKMFSSCKYAFANLQANIGDRNVWGDFTSKKQAKEAAQMWMMAFAKFSLKLEAKVEGKAYRIAVTF